MKTTDKYVLFWGDEDIYSNFYPCTLLMDDNTFHWSEQGFMYLKALFFNDLETAVEILAMNPLNNTPLECKKLGRKVKNFDDARWSLASYAAMKHAVYHKFSQNEELKNQLLETGDLVIVEASPYDKIWGIGLSEDNPDAQDESKWKGSNLLGKVLMDVRTALRNI